MGQNIDVDFSLLGKPPDLVGGYVNAFRVGRELARRPAAPNALGQVPGEADKHVVERIAAMTADQRARGAQRADLLASIGLGLKGVAYEERRAVLSHMAPALAARGAPAKDIAAFDPTDDNIDAAVASAASLATMLAP